MCHPHGHFTMSATIGDWTRDTRFQISNANNSAMAYAKTWPFCAPLFSKLNSKMLNVLLYIAFKKVPASAALQHYVQKLPGFDELMCNCGAEVMFPPIPCGTLPPECHRPCTRQHVCHHPGNLLTHSWSNNIVLFPMYNKSAADNLENIKAKYGKALPIKV